MLVQNKFVLKIRQSALLKTLKRFITTQENNVVLEYGFQKKQNC